jgi:hypothetical protein
MIFFFVRIIPVSGSGSRQQDGFFVRSLKKKNSHKLELEMLYHTMDFQGHIFIKWSVR